MSGQLNKEISKLPTEPGVYLFYGSGKVVLYVGKATALKSRVRSYFSNDILSSRGPLIAEMVSQVEHIDFIQTDSVLEALILESQLIKRHAPKYNTKGKDNKSFSYVIITNEPFPRIFPVRGRELERGGFDFKIKYTFGPFPSGGSLKTALKIVRKIFPFRDRRANQDVNERFYTQLGLTPDTSNAAAQGRYQKTVRNIKLFFEGKKEKLLDTLEREMRAYAKQEDFESAARVRDELFALRHIQDVSLIKEESQEESLRIEAYDVAHISGKHMVGVMTVVSSGEPEKEAYRTFSVQSVSGPNDTAALQEVLTRRLGHPEWGMPGLIVTDGGVAQRNAALSVLNRYGIQIPVVGVVKDERHKPKQILGDKKVVQRYEQQILLANSEAHRFAVSFFRKRQRKQFGS